MGSAALAAAVPYPGKATQISCWGQRSTLFSDSMWRPERYIINACLLLWDPRRANCEVHIANYCEGEPNTKPHSILTQPLTKPKANPETSTVSSVRSDLTRALCSTCDSAGKKNCDSTGKNSKMTLTAAM